MIRKKVQKIIAIALSMSFIGQLAVESQIINASPKLNTVVAINSEVEALAEGPYEQNFDNGDISGWSKVWGG